jgi:hypothetical protein
VVARVEVPVTTKVLVVVELVVVRLVMKEVTALNIEANRLVDVEFVEDEFVVKKLVEVELLITPLIANRLVDVEFVEDEFVVKKLVEVLLVVMRLIIVAEATVRSEMVVVANVDVPVTVNMLDTEDVPALRVLKLPFVVPNVSVKK